MVVLMARNDTQLIKGVLPILLMSLINEKEDYGYSVVERLQAAGFPDLVEGTVYPALTRLESQKFLDSRLVKSESGPARKYYSLNANGKKEYKTRTAAWKNLVANVMPLVGGK